MLKKTSHRALSRLFGLPRCVSVCVHEEFGTRFEITSTSQHYLVAHPRGKREVSGQNALKNFIVRSLTYFRVRGFQPWGARITLW